MAHLLRLIVGIVGAVLLWAAVASAAYATVPTVTLWSTSTLGAARYASAADACVASAAANSSNPNGNFLYGGAYAAARDGQPGQWCFADVTRKDDGSSLGVSWFEQVSSYPGQCPANSNAVSQSACQCTQGFVEVGAQCVPMPKSCEAGKLYSAASTRPLGTGSSLPIAGTTALLQPVPSCADDCALTGGALRAERGLDGNTWTLIVPELRQSGGACTPSNSDLAINTKWDTANDQDKEPSPCATGKCPGSVNGVNVCMPCSASATPSTSSQQSGGTQATTGGANGDGTGTPGGSGGPSVIGSGGASNSSDTTITTCDGKTCTSTTTSTATGSAASGAAGGAAGGAGGNTTTDCAKAAASTASAAAGTATCTNTTTTTRPQAEFCKENPKNASCSNDSGQSSFSGTCAAGFVATGDDAVLNAMAKEEFQQNCKLNPADAETELAATERVKTGNMTGNNPNNGTVSISASQIDTSDALNAGGGCISDVTISVFGGSVVTLPTSRYCDHFAMLGTLLVALSFFAAAVIILRG